MSAVRDEVAMAVARKRVEKVVSMDRGPFRRISMRMHSRVYRLSGGRIGNKLSDETGERPVLVLTTTGRRSGKRRATPLVYLTDGDALVVVASNAGRDADPAWVLNLRADPDAEVRLRARRQQVRAVELDAEEAGPLWPRLDAMYVGYSIYREMTDRRLAVFRLTPR